jgi:hypothetical protein
MTKFRFSSRYKVLWCQINWAPRHRASVLAVLEDRNACCARCLSMRRRGGRRDRRRASSPGDPRSASRRCATGGPDGHVRRAVLLRRAERVDGIRESFKPKLTKTLCDALVGSIRVGNAYSCADLHRTGAALRLRGRLSRRRGGEVGEEARASAPRRRHTPAATSGSLGLATRSAGRGQRAEDDRVDSGGHVVRPFT